MKRKNEERTAPGDGDEIEMGGRVAGPAVVALRDTDLRLAILRDSGLDHREVEVHLAAEAGRKQILLSVAAYLFESLPRIVLTLADQAAQGNLSACKLILDLTGVGESIAETLAAQDASRESTDSLAPHFLKDLPKRLEEMAAKASQRDGK